MSIFSSIRKSRQSAKEHTAKVAEQQKKESEAVPYKHVPTHAALDAISSAPPSWREHDRDRIVEQNRRRSAMPTQVQYASMPSIPRVGSSLSHVSYPAHYASPVVRVPRTYSYTGGLTPYADRSRDVIYSPSEEIQPAYAGSWKGKEVMRPGLQVRGISPTSSKADHSPLHSSSGSTSSQDDLEMRTARPPARPAASAESVHRLHPSNRRRNSETSQERRAGTSQSRAAGASNLVRDSRPPPSMRGFNYITTHAEPVPVPTATRPVSLHAQYAAAPPSTRSSTASLASPTPASAPMTPAGVSPTGAEFPFGISPSTSHEQESAYTFEPAKSGQASPLTPKDRRVPKTARFGDLERIDSHPESTRTAGSSSSQRPAPKIEQERIVNVLPEPATVPEPAPAKSSGRKLTKGGGGGKLKKGSRWSLSKTPAITA